MPRTSLLLAVLSFSIFVWARDAQAYVDPGTGSFLVQGAIAVVLGGLVTLKHYWSRVRGRFGASEDRDELD